MSPLLYRLSYGPASRNYKRKRNLLYHARSLSFGSKVLVSV